MSNPTSTDVCTPSGTDSTSVLSSFTGTTRDDNVCSK
jgi:hypothetical protein